jgi:hypothetical protein
MNEGPLLNEWEAVMFPLRSARRPWFLWSAYAFAVAAPVALILAGRPGRDGTAPAPELHLPADWTTADLLRKLEPLGLRVIPANRTGPLDDGVFLTTTGRGWEELAALHTAAAPGEAALGRWRGTVFVRPSRSPPDTRPLAVSRRSALDAGRFHFYGDPELLDRIEAALSE